MTFLNQMHRLAVRGLPGCLWAAKLWAAEFQIDAVSRGSDGRVQVRFASGVEDYYVLYRGLSVQTVTVPVAVRLGDGEVLSLAERAASGGDAGFYRLERLSQSVPRDSDRDGADDVTELRDPTRDPLDPADSVWVPTVFASAPAEGEGGVAVTRETVLRFSRALAENAVLGTNVLFAEAVGRRMLTRAELSSDRQTATLFFLENLPGSARVRVTLEGDAVADGQGQLVDADADGEAGGRGVVTFDTVALQPIEQTGVEGRVYASEQTAPGQDRPLPGVIVTVDGNEERLRAVTDENGFFRLFPCPSGRFFVHIDGRLAAGSQWPDGAYYPFVGKAWEAVAGRSNNLAGGTGLIYLPLVPADALQPISATETTVIVFPPAVVAQNPALAGVEIVVPPNALFNEQGIRGGRVGIAPVPPDRLPEPLPPGLNLPLVITVQTDGPMNFDTPVPVRFPNLADPVSGVKLPPGAKTAIWSFNHDTGRWEMQGPATVTSDGQYVESDPGVGIRQPGWHGAGGGSGGGGGGPPDCPNCDCETDCDEDEPCLGPDCDEKPRKCPPTPEEAYRLRGMCFVGTGSGTAACLVYELVKDKLDPCSLIEVVGLDELCGQAVDLVVPGSEDCIERVFNDGKACKDFYDDCILHGGGGLVGLHGPGPAVPGAAELEQAEGRLFTFWDEWQTQQPVIDEMWGILRSLHTPEDLSPARKQRLEALSAQLRALRGGRGKFEYFEHWLRIIEADTRAVSRAFGLEPIDRENATGPGYYELTNLDTGFVLRGATTPNGSVPPLVFAPTNDYRLVRYFPRVDRMNFAMFRSSANGIPTPVPLGLTRPAVGVDTDSDGLTDAAEQAIGTLPNLNDSDQDGVSDQVELLQGSNPLDGTPLALGVIASVDTPGYASFLATANGHAYAIDGGSGLAIFNLGDGGSPLLVRQIALGAAASLLACGEDFLALKLGAQARIELYDLPSPDNPVFRARASVTGSLTCLAAGAGVLYAGFGNGRLEVRDPLEGDLIDSFTLPAASGDALDRIEVYAGHLYALGTRSLHVLRINQTSLELVASLEVPGLGPAPLETGRILFVGEGRVFVGHFGGYAIVDVTNPAAPVLTGTPPTTQAAIHSLAGASAQLLTAVTSFGGVVSLAFGMYDISDPTVVNRYLVGYNPPGDPRSVVIHHGLAYLADGPNGVAAVNFKRFGNAATPPSVTLRAHLPPEATVVEGGSSLALTAVVPDDLVMRNVEFYVDGVRRGSDGGYPFQAFVRAPAFTPDKTTFTVRARAIETGGRAVWSNELTLGLGPDLRPPRVRSTEPVGGAAVDPGTLLEVSALFSEPLLPSSLGGGLTVVHAGPNGTLGNADDLPVAGGLQLAEGNARLRFVASFTRPGAYRATLHPTLEDGSGVPFGETLNWDFRVVEPQALSFTPAGGAYRPGGIQTLAVRFSHVMNAGALKNGGIRLLGSGPDQSFGNADDVFLPMGGLVFDPVAKTATVSLAPALPSGSYRFQVTTGAVDTFGNPVTAQTASYTVAFPSVTSTMPEHGHARQEAGLSAVQVVFSDAMDAATLAPNTRLTSAGGDGIHGTPDDLAIGGGTLTYDAPNRMATLTYPAPLPLGEYRLTVLRTVQDAFGNSPRQDFTASFGVHGPIRWGVDANGFWDVAANWTPGRPVPEDAVLIDRPNGDYTITHRQNETTLLAWLQSQEALHLTRGTLRLQQSSWISNLVTVTGPAILEHLGDLQIGGGLRLDGGRVRTAGTLRIDGPLTFEPGSQASAGFVGSAELLARGGSQFTGGAIELDSTRLRLFGNSRWTSGVRFGAAGVSGITVEPGATVELERTATTSETTLQGGGYEPADGTFVWNRGLLRKTGAGQTALVNLVLNSDGEIRVEQGALAVRGPGEHSGRLDVAAGARVTAGQLPAGRAFRFTPASAIEGAGDLEFIPNNGSASIEGRYAVTGTTTIAGGTVDFLNPLELGPGTFFVDFGLVRVLTGFANQQGPVIMGPSATLNIEAATTLPSLRLWGRLGGAGHVTVLSRIAVGGTNNIGNSARIGGSGILEARDGFELRRRLTIEDQRVVLHGGATAWAGTTLSLELDPGARFRNLPGARFEFQSDLAISGSGTFENLGLAIKTGAAGRSSIQPFYEGTGAVEVVSGRLEIWRGALRGPAHVAAGAFLETGRTLGEPLELIGPITGDGELVLGGSTVVSNSLVLPSVKVGNGSHRFAHTTAIPSLTVSNGVTLTLEQPMTLTGTATIGGSTTTVEGPALLRNEGSVEFGTSILRATAENAGSWTATASTVPRMPGVFRNLAGGTFTVTEASGEISGATLPVGTFENQGLLRKVGPESARFRAAVDNAGTIEIDGGTLLLTFPFTQGPDSLIRLLNDGVLRGEEPFEIASRIEGHGSLNPNSIAGLPGTVRNAGVLSPGAPLGKLVIAANFTQLPAGTLEIQIGGKTPVTEHDVLEISPGTLALSATLSGRLAVELVDGYLPEIGDRFLIVTGPMGNVTPFPTREGLNFAPGKKFQVNRLPTGVELEVVSAP